ncbi:AAA family ATPase [Acidipropionibacterium virtanenii]|uniref:ATPase AAA-type core domain-containing protein n=1 Tax=Acidipropionibacterium virtanenii TaxID=2057246 RepID=A0A344URI6_9ACTN|nr:ATP-binding protein [Acidipropionibacterium virtanenii]AXE37884.1 hypothetical protein JS278_00693 [Acidipropionibacterium virtanenii]
MRLIRFAAENHKGLRDRAELDLTEPGLTTLRPKDGKTWDDSLHRVIGIFGANASGKSTVLDALQYMVSAVRNSATAWQAERRMVRSPFALDEKHRAAPSSYELEFILEDVRYEYGFRVGAAGIEEEWLRYVPRARWTNLFTRNHGRPGFFWGSEVKALGEVTGRELVLSRAVLTGHARLSGVGRAIAEDVGFAPLGDVHRGSRVSVIMDMLAKGAMTYDSVTTLLKVADIGINSVSIKETELPQREQELMKRINELLRGDSSRRKGRSVGEAEKVDEDTAATIMRSLEFSHCDGAGRPLRLYEESAGTISWLALAVPAIEALRTGTVLCVDEIDASLHSQLVDILVGMFEDRELNTKGAQMLFTSHDTYLLSNLTEHPLEPDQVWFTEKNVEGATELFSLDDFPRHRDANIARRYLAGRYGAVPRTAPSLLHRVFEESVSGRTEH